MQVQATLRPTAGVSLQASYTWSKLLGTSAASAERGGNYTLPFDRNADYTIQVGDRRHDLRTNGTFTLPFGPDKLLFRSLADPGNLRPPYPQREHGIKCERKPAFQSCGG